MRKKYALLSILIVLLFVWLAWATILVDPFGWQIVPASDKNRFSESGSFGDSFGPLSALMATLAAGGAIGALNSEREARRLERFEANFYTLLANFESIVSQLEVFHYSEERIREPVPGVYYRLSDTLDRSLNRTFKGRAAIKLALNLLRATIGMNGYRDSKIVEREYSKAYVKWADMLGHYFRTLYHIFRLIDEKCPEDNWYYARIVRAQLTNSELVLLCYNCIVGEGRFKFKALAVKYSLFHNLNTDGLDEYEESELDFFKRKLPFSAFRFEPKVEYKYE